MQRLLRFFQTYQNFFIFILLQVVCLTLVVRSNKYQSALFFNSSNFVVGNFLTWSNNVHEYFNLGIENEKLASENARLRKQLATQVALAKLSPDTSVTPDVINQYNFRVAKVINSTTNRENNFVVINKGTADGIIKDMGVISPDGIVGRVRQCSEHFSTVTSVLHSGMMISAKLGRNDVVGTVKWDGTDPEKALLLFIPRHSEIKKGDKIITSGYNNIYPEGVMIGTVSKFMLKPDEPSYYIEVKLSTNFKKLGYVYVIENLLKPELDSLTVKTGLPLETEIPNEPKKP